MKRTIAFTGLAMLAIASLAAGIFATTAHADTPKQTGEFLGGVGLTELHSSGSYKVKRGAEIAINYHTFPGAPQREIKTVELDYKGPDGLEHVIVMTPKSVPDSRYAVAVGTVPSNWEKGIYTLQSVEQIAHNDAHATVQLRNGEYIGLSTFGSDLPKYGSLNLNLKALDLTVR